MPEVCRVTSDDFRNHLTDYLNRAHHAGERTLITRSGLGIAAVVSVEDFELLRALEDRIDGANADEAIRFASESDFIPWDQVR